MDIKYGKNDGTKSVFLKDVVIGFGLNGDDESWVLLEKQGKIGLKDLETPTQYIVNRDTNHVLSMVSPIVSPKPEVRRTDCFQGLETFEDMIKKAKTYFDTFEKQGYEEEVSRLRDILDNIVNLYNRYKGKYKMQIGELLDLFEDLKQLYTYTFTDMKKSELKCDCEVIEPRDPEEQIKLSNIYVGNPGYVKQDPCKRNRWTGMLELVGVEEEDFNKIRIFRNMRSNDFYYVNPMGIVINPSVEMVEKTGIEPSDDSLTSFTEVESLSSAIKNSWNKRNCGIFSKEDKNLMSILLKVTESKKIGIALPVSYFIENSELFAKCTMTSRGFDVFYQPREYSIKSMIPEAIEIIPRLSLVQRDNVKD